MRISERIVRERSRIVYKAVITGEGGKRTQVSALSQGELKEEMKKVREQDIEERT